MGFPKVSILLPVLDEIDHIDRCLESVASQDWRGDLEVLVIDGGSTDGTLEALDGWTARLPLRALPNPARRQSEGLQLAAAEASGEILVRMDAHTTYAPDYVSRSVAVLGETGAEAVGGPMAPGDSDTRFGRAVGRVMRSRLGIGPAPFHVGGTRRAVDTVYLGTFRAETFAGLGGMRTLPTGVAEDADFYWRLRQGGGRVIMDPGIVSHYTPRSTPFGLARQFWRYGVGKADMLYVNGRWPSWRPAAPLVLGVGLIAGTVTGIVWSWLPLFALLTAWLAAVLIAGGGRPLAAVAAGIMHLAYGFGLLRGLLRSPARVRAAVR